MRNKTITASAQDAYELGYLVGSKQMTIHDFCVIDWESDYPFYRRGYNAGAQKYFRSQQNKQQIKKVDL